MTFPEAFTYVVVAIAALYILWFMSKGNTK